MAMIYNIGYREVLRERLSRLWNCQFFKTNSLVQVAYTVTGLVPLCLNMKRIRVNKYTKINHSALYP